MRQDEALKLSHRFIKFLETGEVEGGLFTPEVFCDFTLPRWRLQTAGIDDLVALRKAGHPGPGKVPRWRCDATETGFVLEFEEQWEQEDKDWYAREIARVDAPQGAISSLSVYCTGDWDAEHRAEHAANVKLIRP